MNHTFQIQVKQKYYELVTDGVSQQDIREIESAVRELKPHLQNASPSVIDAIIHSTFESLSGDGHDFGFRVNSK